MSGDESWLIVGAGSQGRVVLEALRAQHPGVEVGFVDDDPSLHGQQVLGAPIVGPATRLASHDGLALLAIGNNPLRLQLAQRLDQGGVGGAGLRWGVVVHPSAVVSPSASIGPGSVVLPRAVVHSGARIEAHVIVNTGSIVEHDCVLADGCSLSPGACMGGRVTIGRGAFISAGATLAPRTTIGEHAIVGAGAVVVADVAAGTLAFGVPAREVRRVVESDWGRVL